MQGIADRRYLLLPSRMGLCHGATRGPFCARPGRLDGRWDSLGAGRLLVGNKVAQGGARTRAVNQTCCGS